MFDPPFNGTPHDTDWKGVTAFFNDVIDQAARSPHDDLNAGLRVQVFSPILLKTIEVSVPARSVEDFMKVLPLFEAELYGGGM